MTRELRIRPARPRDARSFLDAYRGVAAEKRSIRTEAVTHSHRLFRKRFRRSWHENAAHLLALDDDRVVGSISIRRDDHPVTHHVATLDMLVVSTHRRRGVGSALLEEALRWARTYGVERIELSVYPSNDGAIALYRRFGFVQEGRLVRHSKKSYGYEDEILMAFWLGPEPMPEVTGGAKSGAEERER
ncbi:MAG: GNAT family N-acetyltransferase [Actinomycetota bacterium]